jgi:hypothetical protein
MSSPRPATSRLTDFLERLDSGDPQVSEEAARELLKLGERCLPMVHVLARRLNHPTGNTAELLFAVLQQAGPAAVPSLRELLPQSFGRQRDYLLKLTTA